jgi:hypothetical protein
VVPQDDGPDQPQDQLQVALVDVLWSDPNQLQPLRLQKRKTEADVFELSSRETANVTGLEEKTVSSQ